MTVRGQRQAVHSGRSSLVRRYESLKQKCLDYLEYSQLPTSTVTFYRSYKLIILNNKVLTALIEIAIDAGEELQRITESLKQLFDLDFRIQLHLTVSNNSLLFYYIVCIL